MPRSEDFYFDLYRLTINDVEGLFPFMGEPIRTDDQIIAVLQASCDARLDFLHETSSARYGWGLRAYTELASDEFPEGKVVTVTLAKATLDRDGVILTPDAVELGTSVAQPPPAQAVTLVFHMSRHLVAVEHRSAVTDGRAWLRAFYEIVRPATVQLGFTSTIELQEKPKQSEILETFKSFQRLTRMKVHLLLPNPELSRLTQDLYDELSEGGIRHYIADMRNPAGLSQTEGTLPHAAAAMAEDGYKKGDVTLEGIREGRKEKVKTGSRPVRGKVEGIRSFVRGLAATARTQEGRQITDAVLREITRVAGGPGAVS